MANYKRAWQPGNLVFTVVLAERQNNHLLVEQIDLLRSAVREVQERHPFRIHGWVVLPEHLHALLELPEGDTNFPLRWRQIKASSHEGSPIQRLAQNLVGSVVSGDLAATLLGSPDPQSGRFQSPSRLHPYQPRQTWIGNNPERLAIFHFLSLGSTG